MCYPECMAKICEFEGCGRKHCARGLCKMHHQQRLRGKELKPIEDRSPKTLEERFWPKVKFTMYCWEWGAAHHKLGYGVIRETGTNIPSHRYSYTSLVGTIPEGMLIDHLCHNPPCVNPLHLRAVTLKQNLENRSGAQSNSSTGIRGVYLSDSGRFFGRVKHYGTIYHCGTFDTIEEAEQAVIAKRNELFTHNELDRR